MGWTLLLIALVTVSLGLILLGGPLAEWAFDQIGLGGTAVTIWTWLRWPLAILVMMLVYAIVYRVAPGRRRAPLPLPHARAPSSAC